MTTIENRDRCVSSEIWIVIYLDNGLPGLVLREPILLKHHAEDRGSGSKQDAMTGDLLTLTDQGPIGKTWIEQLFGKILAEASFRNLIVLLIL